MVKDNESGNFGGVLWMLASVVLFTANTLLIKAASLAVPGADGWVALLFRGATGIVLLQRLYAEGGKLGWRRGRVRRVCQFELSGKNPMPPHSVI